MDLPTPIRPKGRPPAAGGAYQSNLANAQAARVYPENVAAALGKHAGVADHPPHEEFQHFEVPDQMRPALPVRLPESPRTASARLAGAAGRLLNKLTTKHYRKESKIAAGEHKTHVEVGKLLNVLLRAPDVGSQASDRQEAMRICDGLRAVMKPVVSRMDSVVKLDPESETTRETSMSRAYERKFEEHVHSYLSGMSAHQLKAIEQRLSEARIGGSTGMRPGLLNQNDTHAVIILRVVRELVERREGWRGFGHQVLTVDQALAAQEDPLEAIEEAATTFQDLETQCKSTSKAITEGRDDLAWLQQTVRGLLNDADFNANAARRGRLDAAAQKLGIDPLQARPSTAAEPKRSAAGKAERQANESLRVTSSQLKIHLEVLTAPQTGLRLLNSAFDALPSTLQQASMMPEARTALFSKAAEQELASLELEQLYTLRDNIGRHREARKSPLAGEPLSKVHQTCIRSLRIEVDKAIQKHEARPALQPTPITELAEARLKNMRLHAVENCRRHVSQAATAMADQNLHGAVAALHSINTDIEWLMKLDSQLTGDKPNGAAALAKRKELVEHAFVTWGLAEQGREQPRDQLRYVLGHGVIADLNTAVHVIAGKLANRSAKGGALATNGQPLGLQLRGMDLVLGVFVDKTQAWLAPQGQLDPHSERFGPVFDALDIQVEAGRTISANGVPDRAFIDPDSYLAPRDSRDIFGADAPPNLLIDLRASARGEGNMVNFHVLDALQSYATRPSPKDALDFVQKMRSVARDFEKNEWSNKRDEAISRASTELNTAGSWIDAKHILNRLRSDLQQLVFENSKQRFPRVNGVPV